METVHHSVQSALFVLSDFLSKITHKSIVIITIFKMSTQRDSEKLKDVEKVIKLATRRSVIQLESIKSQSTRSKAIA